MRGITRAAKRAHLLPAEDDVLVRQVIVPLL